MGTTIPIDIPEGTTRTQQVAVTGSYPSSFVPTPISINGTLDVTGNDAIFNSGIFPPITLISNSGTIKTPVGFHGINNAATINKVVNAQGAGNVAGPLTYTGNLPGRYEIIVKSPTDYGILAVGPVSGPMAFGIYNGDIEGIASSILTATTYTSVLQGFADLTNISGLTGTFADSFNYSIIQQGEGTNWDLVVTAMTLPDITTGNSVELSNVGITVEPVFNGGTLLLSSGDQSSLAFDVLTNGGFITAPDSGNALLSGVMSGTGALTFNGLGTTIISGANTYSGGTTVTAGTLQGDTSSLQGAIVNNSSVVFDQATDGTYTNVMSGTGGLTKSGNGVLTLTGANTYSGGTTVSAGSLSIAGTSPTGSGSVTIDHGATLSGRGVVLGKVFVAGSLKPGNSPGYMSVMSDVTMKAGSSYLQDIAGTVQANDNSLVGATGYYSYLNAQGGAFIIEQGANLVPQLTNLFSVGQPGYGTSAFIPALGDRFRIITAGGGIEGKFSGIIQPEGLDSGTSLVAFYNIQNSKSIDLAVIPSSYPTTIAAGSGNKNAISVGAVLDQIARSNQTGAASQSQDQLLNAIASQGSARGIADYAQSLSGEVYAATVAVSAQTTQRMQQTIRSQLGLAYLTGPIEGRLGLAANTSQLSNNSQKASGSGLVWGNATFQRGVRSSDDNAGGWNNNLYQLAFGSDFYNSQRVKVGGGFSLSNSTLSPTHGSATIQQGSIFAYGKFLLHDYVVDAVASIGLSSSDISRSDVTGLSNGFRDTSVSGKDAMLSLGLSRPIELTNLFLTPYAQVSWQGALQRGVNEGDTPAALNVGRFTGNAVRGVLGLGLGSKGTNPSIDKYTYGAYVGVGADSSNLLNPTLNASLANINIDISTPIAGKFFVQAGLYGTIRVSKGTFAYLGLSGEAREQQTLGTFNIGLRALF
jgi:autotransporter-associated beta strand protein